MNPLWWVVLAATALSGFFALNGIALQSFRRVKLEEAFAGPGGGRRLDRLDRHLASLKMSVSFCRAISNLVLVVAIMYLFDPAHKGLASAVQATALAGGILAVFGVAVPGAWASYAGEKVLSVTLEILFAVRYILYPVVLLMQGVGFLIRRLAGADGEEPTDGESARQEILQVASEGRAEGAVDADEVEMIASIIEFGQTQAGEIMTPRTDIFALPVDMPLEQACENISAAAHTRVPVFQGDLDNIVGVVYVKDLLGVVGKSPPATLRSILRKPFFVPESKRLDDLLTEFKARKVHLAIVLDEYGGTAGLITVEDVVEEIVGEIDDEYDLTEPALMQRIDEQTSEVDGRMYVDDLNDAMDLNIPDDRDYTTVAGMVFSELGYVPSPGEKLDAFGAKFTVLAADNRKITRLRVERLEQSQEREV